MKSLACELPYTHGLPLSRFSLAEIQGEVIGQGLVASIGKTTIWRWLSQDAIRPWFHRSWIFPRDPQFAQKAGPILDLYEGIWKGRPLSNDDCVVSTDEKTSIQARRREHPSLPPAPGHATRVEHAYARRGALAYLAAWDVRRARIFGRCEPTTGIAPFQRLVSQVMSEEPYRSARRVFWIMDNGSSHRGHQSNRRLMAQWPNIVPLHTPVHASWLNQVEIYFSVIQRKVLTPNYFESTAEIADRLRQFQQHYEQAASPFQWKFTRSHLHKLLKKIQALEVHAAAA